MKKIKKFLSKLVIILVTITLIFTIVRVTANIIKEEKVLYLEVPSGYNPQQIANMLKELNSGKYED